MFQRIANIIFKIDLQYTNLNQFRLDVVKSNCGFWSFLIFNLWIWSLFATFSPLLQNFFETFLWCILPLCFPGIWPALWHRKLAKDHWWKLGGDNSCKTWRAAQGLWGEMDQETPVWQARLWKCSHHRRWPQTTLNALRCKTLWCSWVCQLEG